MADLPAIFQRALTHHQAGEMSQAIGLYDSILRQAPTHADTLYLRGLASLQVNDLTGAEKRLREAVKQQPTRVPYWVTLGQTYLARGELSAAREALEKAQSMEEASGPVHAAMGDLCLREGQPAWARHHYEQALAQDEQVVVVWTNLSQSLLMLEEYRQAREAAERALALDSTSKEARFNRAVAARGLGDVSAAAEDYRTILAADPRWTPARINLANLLNSTGRIDQSLDVLKEGLAEEPTSGELLFALGSGLHEAGDFGAAIEQYRSLLQHVPGHRRGAANLASALRQTGRWQDGIEVLEGLTSSEPSDAGTLIQLGHAHLEQEDDEKAGSVFERVLHLGRRDWTDRVRLARTCPLLYRSTVEIARYRESLEQNVRELLADRRPVKDIDVALAGLEPSFHWPFHGYDDRPIKELYSQLFEEIDWSRWSDERRPTGRPHVGLVVTDSHEPVFLRSMGGMIERLAKSDYRLTLVVSRRGAERIRDRLSGCEIEYLLLPNRLSGALTAVGQARFDLLFYWEIGTDSLNYFLPMARLARVQAVSWGVPVTSGHRWVDDYLSSDLLEPVGGERDYTERLVRFRRLLSYQERRRPVQGVGRERWGLSAGEQVYVCSQNLGKFHPDFVGVLAEILERDPAGRLVVTSSRHPRPKGMLDEILSSALGGRMDRVLILPPLDVTSYHQLLGLADVQLDPFPFCGANTSYDAFSYDLPVVTVEGRYQRGRFTSGCYRAMGLAEWVAVDREEYIERAVAWGTCPDRRHEAIKILRERTPVLFEDGETPREWEEYVNERLFS